MRTTAGKLEQKAEQTLRAAGALQVPVPIEKVANHLNLTMEAGRLEDVSGILIVRGDRGAIGYNSTHSVMRRRFTVAHEISHFLLHTRRKRKPQLFADKHVLFRLPSDDRASHRSRRDLEANQLGAALLMPGSAVFKEIEFYGSDLDDEVAIRYLANRFRVSVAVMANRLMSLGLLLL